MDCSIVVKKLGEWDGHCLVFKSRRYLFPIVFNCHFVPHMKCMMILTIGYLITWLIKGIQGMLPIDESSYSTTFQMEWVLK